MIVREIALPTSEQIEAVNSQLRLHNQTANRRYIDKLGQKEYQPYPVNLFALDSDEKVVGGLFGTIQMNWLKVSVMAVRKEHRGMGIGSNLLKRAEEMARERSCQRAYLDTMEYQGLEFYQKNGYQVVGELEDWDSHGHAKFFLVKRLGVVG